MRLLITGAKGQVGSELARLGSAHELLAVDHDGLDICDAKDVRWTMAEFRPDVVINAAAYTAVDRAESDRDTAFAVNRDGPENLARACDIAEIPLIHISTDYVFDGSKQGVYIESDCVAPLGIYGESKLAGELAVMQYCSRHIILRTSWVFSVHGNNFVKTMLRLAAEREELGVVADQYGKPTSATEIARLILELLHKLSDNCWGIYNLAQPETTNWHSFAEAIFDEARSQGVGLKVAGVRAIETSEYRTPAKRPVNSVLNCHKLESQFDVKIKPWRESLSAVIHELKGRDCVVTKQFAV